MRRSIAIAGIVILLIGIAVIGYSYAAGPTQQEVSAAVIPSTSRNIDANGIWTAGSHVLQRGEQITGTYAVNNYNASAGPIFMLILNESQWADWGGCAPCTSPNLMNKTISSSSANTFTWTVPYTGAFYFAVDDSSYGQSASASFGANTTTMASVSSSANYAYAGVAAIILGAVVLAVGIIMASAKPKPITSQPKSVAPDQPSQKSGM